MTHPDQELLAQYIGGELAPALARAVADHLAACPACRATALAFDRQTGLLREAVLALPAPRLRRAPRRSWAPVVAAAVVLAFALAMAASPTLAQAVVRFFPFGKVYELSPQEVAEEVRRQEAEPPYEGSQYRCPRYSDREEAIAAWEWPSGQVMEPTYLPEGYQPWRYSPCKSVFTTVYMHFGEGRFGSTFEITQGPLNGATWRMPEGAGREVKIKGKPAILIRGTWAQSEPGGQVSWESSLQQLWFEYRGQSVLITQLRGQSPATVNLTDEELIKIAASMK